MLKTGDIVSIDSTSYSGKNNLANRSLSLIVNNFKERSSQKEDLDGHFILSQWLKRGGTKLVWIYFAVKGAFSGRILFARSRFSWARQEAYFEY